MSESLKLNLLNVYERLFHSYGPQHWWPGDGAFEVIIGAILTQGVGWLGADKSITNLKSQGLMEPSALRTEDQAKIANLIRPSIYFNRKAQKIKSFVHHLGEYYNDDLDSLLEKDTQNLRHELLSIYGIGEETADDIVLYAANKPIFVIDTYTRRVLNRLSIIPNQDTYSSYQAIFMDNLPHNPTLFNEFHALLDRHAAETCRKNRPKCKECSLLDICPYGIRITAEQT